MFEMKIHTDNASFQHPVTGESDDYWEAVELSEILDEVTRKLMAGKKSGIILDMNGNKVGEWSRR